MDVLQHVRVLGGCFGFFKVLLIVAMPFVSLHHLLLAVCGA